MRVLMIATVLLAACTETNPNWDPCATGDPSCDWDAGPQWHGDLGPACGQAGQPCCVGDRCYAPPIAGKTAVKCVNLPPGLEGGYVGPFCFPCGYEGEHVCNDSAGNSVCAVGLISDTHFTCVTR